jgi:ABC-type Mn2+/Zn2+ transport system permease subunit/Mn-dependent DtxR family transcriptional regulator
VSSTLLHDLLVAPVRDFGFMRDGLLVVVMIGLTAAVLSCLLVVRRQALMGDAIAHSVLLGVALGWLVAREAGLLIGALLAGMLSGVAMTFVERAGIRLDSAMGVVFTASFALGLAIISAVKPTGIDLFHVLLGNVLGVTPDGVVRTLVGCSIVLGVVLVCFRGLQFWSFDPVAAAVGGLPVRLLHYVFTMLLSATIVVSIQAVGILLVIAMLVTPGAAAGLLANRLAPMMVVAAAIGVASGVIGLFGSYHLDVASGPSIVLVASAFFVLALLAAPGRGVLSRMVAQRRARHAALDDDLLKDIALAACEEGLAPSCALSASRLGLTLAQVERALARLRSRGLLAVDATPRLTQAGERRATELVRTQRVLERYLHEVERVPLGRVRNEADRREHDTSTVAVEEMASVLGQPRTDPHGHPIPLPTEEGLRRIVGQSLLATAPGQGGRVVMVSDDRPDLLDDMVERGILPDSVITVVAATERALQIRINDGPVETVHEALAERVFLMPRLRILKSGSPARRGA